MSPSMCPRLIALVVIFAASMPASARLYGYRPETRNESGLELPSRQIAQELNVFRTVGLSIKDAITIAENHAPGAKAVDVSFDGQSEVPIYRVKLYQRKRLLIGGLDASTGQVANQVIEKPTWTLDDNDRSVLSDFTKQKIDFSDVVLIAEQYSSGKAISIGLLAGQGKLAFSVVVLVDGRLKQVVVAPSK